MLAATVWSLWALSGCGGPAPAPSVDAVALGPPPEHRVFPSAAAAVSALLQEKPRVIGVGELHSLNEGPAIRSTLVRFREELLPVLAPVTTDLVIETWRVTGRCGAEEAVVAAQVQVETKRPEVVKSEVLLLAEAALALGVQPHDITFTCEEHAAFLDAAGQLQMEPLLLQVTRKLGEYEQKALDTPTASLVIYGGALHNNLIPMEGFEAYSYALPLGEAAGRAYIELDLYAPEQLRAKDTMVEPAWAPLIDLAGPGRAVLVTRGPGSYVLLLDSPPVAPVAPAASP